MPENAGEDKPVKGQAQECYVLDEYLVEDSKKDGKEEQRNQKGNDDDKKRGQNKKRPVFKVNNKVRSSQIISGISENVRCTFI